MGKGSKKTDKVEGPSKPSNIVLDIASQLEKLGGVIVSRRAVVPRSEKKLTKAEILQQLDSKIRSEDRTHARKLRKIEERVAEERAAFDIEAYFNDRLVARKISEYQITIKERVKAHKEIIANLFVAGYIDDSKRLDFEERLDEALAGNDPGGLAFIFSEIQSL